MCLALSRRVHPGDLLGYAAATGIVGSIALYRFLIRREQDRNWLRAKATGAIRELIARGTHLQGFGHGFGHGGPDDARSAGEAWRGTVARTLRGTPFKAGADRFVLEHAGDRFAGPLQRLCEMLAAPDPWINFEA
jgi:hypothetical protein